MTLCSIHYVAYMHDCGQFDKNFTLRTGGGGLIKIIIYLLGFKYTVIYNDSTDV